MKRYFSIVFASAIVFASFIFASSAKSNNEAENNLAKEMAILVIYTEVSNIGSRDPDCRGTPFIIMDTDTLVQEELAPIIYELKIKSEKSDLRSREMAIDALKTIPYQDLNGMSVAENSYQKIKQRSVSAFGSTNACASLSSMIQTVIHQKRLTIEILSKQINSD